jgi:hypothetical protein
MEGSISNICDLSLSIMNEKKKLLYLKSHFLWRLLKLTTASYAERGPFSNIIGAYSSSLLTKSSLHLLVRGIKLMRGFSKQKAFS